MPLILWCTCASQRLRFCGVLVRVPQMLWCTCASERPRFCGVLVQVSTSDVVLYLLSASDFVLYLCKDVCVQVCECMLIKTCFNGF